MGLIAQPLRLDRLALDAPIGFLALDMRFHREIVPHINFPPHSPKRTAAAMCAHLQREHIAGVNRTAKAHLIVRVLREPVKG